MGRPVDPFGSGSLYDIARQVTDEVLGEGTYAEINKNNPDPGVQQAITKSRSEVKDTLFSTPEYKLVDAVLGPRKAADIMDGIATEAQKDDVKQVIVMRTDLGMTKGKMIAQGAHASIAFLTNKYRLSDFQPDFLSSEERQWIEGIFTKICVRVDSEQELRDIYAAARSAGLTAFLIEDRGLTQFKGVITPTAVGIGPNKATDIDQVTGHLRLL